MNAHIKRVIDLLNEMDREIQAAELENVDICSAGVDVSNCKEIHVFGWENFKALIGSAPIVSTNIGGDCLNFKNIATIDGVELLCLTDEPM